MPSLDMPVFSAAQATPGISTRAAAASATDRRRLFDGLLGEYQDVAVHWRDELAPGSRIAGPAIIAESQTATVVSAVFDARIDRFGHIVLERRP